jgi:hypothetical protein
MSPAPLAVIGQLRQGRMQALRLCRPPMCILVRFGCRTPGRGARHGAIATAPCAPRGRAARWARTGQPNCSRWRSPGTRRGVRALLPSAGSLAEDSLPGTSGGATALMGAAAGGHEAVVALLLECGADASRRDTPGRSAAYARAAGHPHLAERLDTVVDVEKTMR